MMDPCVYIDWGYVIVKSRMEERREENENMTEYKIYPQEHECDGKLNKNKL